MHKCAQMVMARSVVSRPDRKSNSAMRACSGGEGSGASSAERMPKNWAEVAAALLGPVDHRSQQLTSAFSDALRGGAPTAACVPLLTTC